MTHRKPTPRRVGLLAASLALAASTLAGCGDSDADPTPELSIDSSADAGDGSLPEGVPTEAPEGVSGLKNTPADAKKYAEYAFRRFQFSVATRDLAPLRELGQCPSCDWARDSIAKMKREGYFEIPDGPIKVHTVAELYRDGKKIVMGVSYSLPTGKKLSEDGKVLDTLDAARKKFMEVGIIWKGNSWQLFDLSITD